MKASSILLNPPVVFQLPSEAADLPTFENCSLAWEQDVLTVALATPGQRIEIPALQNTAWLQNCLRHSPVTKVYLDPALGESVIKAWIEICQATQKQIFLSSSSMLDLPQLKRPRLWRIKRLVDWLAAALLLLLLSPLMVLLAVCVLLESSGPVLFRQWRVGYQGQLFQIYKFRSMQIDAEAQHHQIMEKNLGQLHKLKNDPRVTRVGNWLRKLSLDELPQLLNVLRGEMSLVGPRPWAIYDAIRIEPVLQGRFRALPGITGAWQVEARSEELDLRTVNGQDLAYLQNWTLWNDLKILLLTIPKVMFGVGAY